MEATMDTPYRVERRTSHNMYTTHSYYAIVRAGDGELCQSDDCVFLHRVVELLNEEECAVEGR